MRSFKSTLQGFRASGFQGFRASRLQGFRAFQLFSLAALLFAVLQSCSLAADVVAVPVAKRILSPSELLGGRRAHGQIGDILMQNDKLKVIIMSLTHFRPGAESGGNIIDAAPIGIKNDDLTGIVLYLNQFPRQAKYDRLEITKDGSDGTAQVTASGVDSFDGTLQVTTTYTLTEGVNYVVIKTTVRNNGQKALKGFELGDMIAWGYARVFAPLLGFRAQRRTTTADWVVGKGKGVCYGWCTKEGNFKVISGGYWSDPIALKADIPPGGEVSYERYFIVEKADIAAVAATAYRLQGKPLGEVHGKVTEWKTKKPVSEATVTAFLPKQPTSQPANHLTTQPPNHLTSTMQPFVETPVDATGSFRLALPPGTYFVSPHHVARRTLKSQTITVAPDRRSNIVLMMSGAGKVVFEVRDAITGELIPAKLTFLGTGKTPNPDFGPSNVASGAQNVVLTHNGIGTRSIPAGTYEVVVSRGIEYEIQRVKIRVLPDVPVKLQARLRRSVDTTGYISADFHQHAEHSYDSSVSLFDRVISNLAEGVEFIASSDHDHVTDYAPIIEKLNAQRFIKSCIGDEITTRDVGHFNGFPLVLDPTSPTGGAIAWQGMSPQQIFDAVRAHEGEQVVQVNHPRAGRIGYFNLLGFDPKTAKASDERFSFDFDAVEVMNGKVQHVVPSVLQDWFSLLNAGYKITAVANSDTHHIVIQEAGFPRNFVFLGKDDPQKVTTEEVVSAVLAGRVVLSMGPFVHFSADGKFPVGSVISKPNGSVSLNIVVKSPLWIDVSHVVLYANGQIVQRFSVHNPRSIEKFHRTIRVNPDKDTWFVVVTVGEKPLAPVVPDYIGSGGMSYPVTPLAITNPIWLDRDGNGKFDAQPVTVP